MKVIILTTRPLKKDEIMKFALLFASLWCSIFLKAQQSIEEVVKRDLMNINNAYDNQFFLYSLNDSIQIYEYLNIDKVGYVEINEQEISLIKVGVILSSNLYLSDQKKDTMCFYILNLGNKYYRLFGFLYSDLRIVLDSYHDIKIKDVIKLMSSEGIKNISKRKIKFIIKRKKQTLDIDEFPIQVFINLGLEKMASELHSILLPSNDNQFIIID